LDSLRKDQQQQQTRDKERRGVTRRRRRRRSRKGELKRHQAKKSKRISHGNETNSNVLFETG
jgi:hypothetical protein